MIDRLTGIDAKLDRAEQLLKGIDHEWATWAAKEVIGAREGS